AAYPTEVHRAHLPTKHCQNRSLHRGPSFALRINNIEVVCHGDHRNRHGITLASCQLCPPPRHLWRNLVILRTPNQNLRQTERQQVSRAPRAISVLKLGRRSAHQVVHPCLSCANAKYPDRSQVSRRSTAPASAITPRNATFGRGSYIGLPSGTWCRPPSQNA